MKTHTIAAALAIGLLTAFPAGASPVNINTADAQMLAEALSGVGPVTSQEIVTYREKNGGFEKPEDLMNVNGIGQATFDNNKADILVKE